MSAEQIIEHLFKELGVTVKQVSFDDDDEDKQK